MLEGGEEDDLYEELELDSDRSPRSQPDISGDPAPLDGRALTAPGEGEAIPLAGEPADDEIELQHSDVQPLQESDEIELPEGEIVDLADDDELFDRENTNLSAGLEDD